MAVYMKVALNLSLTQVGTLISASSLGVVIGMGVAGLLVDRIGPRRLQAAGTGIIVLFTALMVVWQGYEAILIGLFLVGLTVATVPSAGSRAVFHAFSGGRLGFAMGIRQMGVPLGAALAAALIPLTVTSLGLSGIWVALAVIIGVAGLAFVAVAPRTWKAPSVTGGQHSLRELSPALAPALIGILLVAGQYCTLGFTILDLHLRNHWSLGLAGLGLALTQVGGGVGRIFLGWVSDRLGGRRAPVVGSTALLGALSALAMATLSPTLPAPALWVLLFLLGVGTVGWNSLVLTWAGESVPVARSGLAMTWTGGTVFLGSAIYPPIFGYIVDVTHQFSLAWLILSVLLFLTALLALSRGRLTGGPSTQEA